MIGVTTTNATAGFLDPFPRKYPVTIALVRRSAGTPGSLPSFTTFSDVEAWLLDDAARERDTLNLVETLIWRLRAAAFPIDRFSLHIGTLHPQLIGFAWNWNSDDGYCDEVRVTEAVVRSDAYRLNPLQSIFTTGEMIRRSPQDPAARAEFPIMAELADAGLSEYIAIPLSGLDARNAVRNPHGFSEQEVLRLDRILKIFALHVQRHSEQRISSNALNAYLGASAATQVLNGSIKRGAGKAIRAVIWVSDLRDFTVLSDLLPASDMLKLLNAYFEAMADAVLSNGGEVLKFVGDGLLAVFPVEDDNQIRPVANRALLAAKQALSGLRAINDRPSPHLPDRNVWYPLRAGIAIHEGDLFFGNIGSPARLDFTVIGAAVNEACRVEALQRKLGEDILLTYEVARHINCRLEDLGRHALKGVSTPVSLYCPWD
jgi:adenylate cyclase